MIVILFALSVNLLAPRPNPNVVPQKTSDLVAAAAAAIEELEYDTAASLAARALRRDDLTVEQRLSAYFTSGVVLVVMNRDLEGEQFFRLLLRLRLDFSPPASTPGKALASFRKVLVDEQALAARMRADARNDLIATQSLTCALPSVHRGGHRLPVSCTLVDPRRAVDTVRLQYRRQGEQTFSVLPLRLDTIQGTWAGSLPNEWTENQDGMVVELFASTTDRDGGELIAQGSAASPMRIDVAPGTVASARPFYQRPWFWAVSAAVAVGVGVTAVVLHQNATRLPSHDLGPVELPE